MHPKVSKSTGRDDCPSTFTNTLFTTVKIADQLTSAPADVWMKKTDFVCVFPS